MCFRITLKIASLLFLFILVQPVLNAASYDKEMLEVEFYYGEGRKLAKTNNKKDRQLALAMFERAQQILMPIMKTEDDEVLLSKINREIYWINKFTTLGEKRVKLPSRSTFLSQIAGLKESDIQENKQPEEIAETQKEVTEEPKDDNLKAQEEAKLQAKKEEFEKRLAVVKQYEEKNPKDYYNNYMNYLSMQDFAYNTESADLIIGKTAHFMELHRKKSKTKLQEILDDIRNYDQMLADKEYDKLLSALGTRYEYLRRKGEKEAVLKDLFRLALEVKVLKQLVDLIKNERETSIPVGDAIPGLNGSVIAANDEKLTLILNGGQRSYISWSTVSEQGLLKMASFLMEKRIPTKFSEIKSEKEREQVMMDYFRLGVANLRLKNFREGYFNFLSVYQLDEEGDFKYRSYLTNFLEVCESGYRATIAADIEGKLKEALVLASNGRTQSALNKLDDLKQEYFASSLDSISRMYQERLYQTYKEVRRK